MRTLKQFKAKSSVLRRRVHYNCGKLPLNTKVNLKVRLLKYLNANDLYRDRVTFELSPKPQVISRLPK